MGNSNNSASETTLSPFSNSIKFAKSSSDMLIDAHLMLYKQIEGINRQWLDRLEETRESEVALGNEILKCPNPLEAAALCREWMQRRATLLASDMQDFGKLWMQFCTEMAVKAKVDTTSDTGKAGQS